MTSDHTQRILELLDAQTPFSQATVLLAPSGPAAVPAGGATTTTPAVAADFAEADTAACIPGQKMLVLADGQTEGSLGSPAIDATIAREAIARMHDDTIAVLRLDASGQVLPPRRLLRDAGITAGVIEVAIEPLLPAPHLIIIGAGHIAVPLARFARILGFHVTVIDDRARFASPERFPDADLVVGPFDQEVAAQRITRWTYLVLVTRGHEHDEAVLQQIVQSPAPYIGMIGSRRRVLLVFQRLAARGVSEQFIDRIYAPVGLDIGSRTPEEIALAIAAEIVNVRRSGNAPSLALRRRIDREP